jgi:hypothetical protein
MVTCDVIKASFIFAHAAKDTKYRFPKYNYHISNPGNRGNQTNAQGRKHTERCRGHVQVERSRAARARVRNVDLDSIAHICIASGGEKPNKFRARGGWIIAVLTCHGDRLVADSGAV